jgi:hypothetical protein
MLRGTHTGGPSSFDRSCVLAGRDHVLPSGDFAPWFPDGSRRADTPSCKATHGLCVRRSTDDQRAAQVYNS